MEKEKELGGDCLHFGCVPSKTLIASARVYHLLKHSDRYGLPRVEVPPPTTGPRARPSWGGRASAAPTSRETNIRIL